MENSKGEWGRGQHEMNIRYAELLDMADRHTIMKQAMKEIADETGVSITFMAKPDMSEAGSSCHLHVSLWEGDNSAFPGDQVFGPVHGSDTFRWFLGGWMAHVPELMVFFAPDRELLQALPGRFVGADPARLELRQPHRRVPGGRPRPEPPHRVPDPGCRCQPLSRLLGGSRRRAGRDRQPDRPAGDLRGRRLPGPGAAPSPLHPP